MDYRTIFNNQTPIKKLRDTSMLPWEDVIETSDFFSDIDRESEKYNRLQTKLQIKYARFGLINLKKREESKDANDDSEEKIDVELTILSSDGLTVNQLESRETDTELLLNTQAEEIRLPAIDMKVIKKLYNDSQTRREKEAKESKKKEEEIKTEKEPYFTVDDVRAYIALGITKKAKPKSE